jgi:hypothetical protein
VGNLQKFAGAMRSVQSTCKISVEVMCVTSRILLRTNKGNLYYESI